MKAADLRAALTALHSRQEYALMFEVNEGTGLNLGRRADALLVSLWPSRGLEVTVFEIKVSRADWLSELRAPEKMEAIGAYADRIVLFTAPGVAKAEEIPELWGHWELRASGTVCRAKAAPKLEPAPVDRSVLAAWMRARAKLDSDDIAALRQRFFDEFNRNQVRRDREREARAISKSEAARIEKADARLAEIKERTGIDLTDFHPTDDWVERIELAGDWRFRNGLQNVLSFMGDDRLRERLQAVLGWRSNG